MRELAFVLEFRGKAFALPDGTRQAKTTALCKAVLTMLAAGGVRVPIDGGSNQTAELEASVRRFGDGTFVEEGTIRYGAAGAIAFETIGRGWVNAGPVPGSSAGGVMWSVTSGDGVFAGACGVIASTFTVSADGDVVDDHVARMYIA